MNSAIAGSGQGRHNSNWTANNNFNGRGGYYGGNYGNWNGRGNWNGNRGYGNSFYRGFGFSPFLGFYPYGYGFGGLGYGYGYGRYGAGFGWGLPFFGYNRFCNYGYGGYGGYPSYGYYSYGYPNDAYAYTADYAATEPVTTVDEVQAVPADAAPTVAADNSFAAEGEALFSEGDYAGAARAWRHAIVDDPDNATLFVMMSQALFAAGEYDESAGALQQGLMRMPEEQWGVVVENYRELYPPNDDYANQLKALEKAAKEKPDDPAMQVLLGYHYGYLGYPVQAVEKLNRTMELAPQDQMAQKLREVMAAKAAAKGQAVQPAPALPAEPSAATPNS